MSNPNAIPIFSFIWVSHILCSLSKTYWSKHWNVLIHSMWLKKNILLPTTGRNLKREINFNSLELLLYCGLMDNYWQTMPLSSQHLDLSQQNGNSNWLQVFQAVRGTGRTLSFSLPQIILRRQEDAWGQSVCQIATIKIVWKLA